MKNVIMLVIDSLCYDILGDKRYGRSATEFLDSIKNDCIFANNLYSQGPYTEAGLKALLCSRNTMDDGGYLQRFGNASSFFLDPFKDAGYEIYHSFYQLLMYSSSIREKIDNVIYIDLFDYRLEWSALIPYYISKKNKGILSEYDISNCIMSYDVMFSLMKEQYCMYGKYKEKNDRYELIQDIIPPNLEELSQVILEELEKYKNDKKKYILDVLEKEKEHTLYKKIDINNKAKVCEETLKSVLDDNPDFLDNAKKISHKLNKYNSRFSFAKMVKSYFTDKVYFANALTRLGRYHDYDDFIDKQKDMYVPSMGRQITYMMNCIKERKDSSAPFFFQMHFEEAHYFNTFLSYDIDDPGVIQSEIDTHIKDLEQVNSNYPGLLQYRQAVVYVDLWIRKLFCFLEKERLLDDTIVLITADHGSSYCYEPIRNERLVTNCHTANYHIPMYLYNKGSKGRIIDGYHTSIDVIPTLLDVVGIRKTKGMKGTTMLDENVSPTICHSEYLGSGTPDIVEKPIQYVARNEKYLVSYYVKASDPFEKGKIVAVYDLINDPGELKDIKDKIASDEIQSLMDYLNNRHREVNLQYLDSIHF